jgi:hypothetical protein
VTRGLRYRFGNDQEMKHFWIEDTQGARTHWQIDRGQQVTTNNYRDYVIVARFVNPTTGQPLFQPESLTQPANMEAMRRNISPNWEGENMEFVLSTEIIEGRSAPPKIEAMYFW